MPHKIINKYWIFSLLIIGGIILAAIGPIPVIGQNAFGESAPIEQIPVPLVDPVLQTLADAQADEEIEGTKTPLGGIYANSPKPSWEIQWPLWGGFLSSKFGPRWGRHHSGIDIGAEYGERVIAVQAGIVVSAGYKTNGYGYSVDVDHGDGVSTTYGHLQKIKVSVGTIVRQGTTVGTVGSSGNSTGPHLHFEIQINGKALDPLLFLPNR